MTSWLSSAGEKLFKFLPHGRVLAQQEWDRRHRAIVIILWLHVVGLAIFGLLRGYSAPHVAIDAGAVTVFAAWATQPFGGRRVRATLASLGLLTASAVLVHLSGGIIEAHFHFFVVIALLMLYQDWVPFLVAIGYVVVHHGVVGTLYPASVYNTTAAQQDPWLWAGIHAVFVLAASGANLVYWRLSESDHAAAIAAEHDSARIDGLTGAVNRRGWEEELSKSLALARRNRLEVSVALLDFDNFKDYNDSQGHQRGDQLLMASVRAWKTGLRAEDTLARYGGDEFGLILPGSNLTSALQVLERLRELTPDGQTCSIGVARWDGRENGEEMVARIDAALYEGKKRKEDEERGIHVAGRMPKTAGEAQWSERLPRIIAGHSIESAYQPIVRLHDLSPVGFEALARPTDDPSCERVDDMFDAAQRLGHARDLDWVCRQAAMEGRPELELDQALFVNVSLSALFDPAHSVEEMVLLARWTGCSPAQVVLEIKEQEQSRDLKRLAGVVKKYRAHGFRFALDDVGAGTSTLDALMAIDPEYIKISRRLTASVESRAFRSAIAAIFAFAIGQGSQVIAGGIEDAGQLRAIQEIGVTLGQGYGLGRPQRQVHPRAEAEVAS